MWSVALVLCLASASYGNPPTAPLITPAPTLVSTPVPKTAPTPKPVAVRHAPAGVLYLMDDTIVALKHGLQGIAAGTEVRMLQDNGDTVQVSAGDFQFTMKKTQVTDDLDIAAAVQKRTAAAEAANEASRRVQEALLVKQQHDEIEFLRTHPLSTPTPTPRK